MRKEIEQAIKVHQGEILPLGSVVAHPSDPMTYELIMYDGDFAVLSWNGVTKRFPANEIFDANRVKNTAVSIHVESIFENAQFN
jgi:hypothetical protein